MKSPKNEKMKCPCGKEMEYDSETGVWNCDDSVYVPADAKLTQVEEKYPRMLTHPSLIIAFVLIAFAIGWIVLFSRGLLAASFIVPLGLATYFLGYWNRLMIDLEEQGY